VPALLELLTKDGDENVRDAAANAIGKLGPSAKAAVPALTGYLKDKSADLRETAALALGRIGDESWTATSELLSLLKDPEERVRESAAETLYVLTPLPPEAVPALVKALKDEDRGVRALAAECLGDMGSDAEAAIPDLIKALKKNTDPEERRVRAPTAEALGLIGSRSKEVVQALADQKGDKSTIVRCAAAQALAQLGANKGFKDKAVKQIAVDALVGMLTDKSHPTARYAAAEALGDFFAGTKAPKSVFKALTDASNRKFDPAKHKINVQKAAKEALAKIKT